MPGLPGCLKAKSLVEASPLYEVMIRKGGELFNQSPDPARRRRRVAIHGELVEPKARVIEIGVKIEIEIGIGVKYGVAEYWQRSFQSDL